MKRITPYIRFNIATPVSTLALLASQAGAQSSSPAQDQALGDYARKIRKDPGAQAQAQGL